PPAVDIETVETPRHHHTYVERPDGAGRDGPADETSGAYVQTVDVDEPDRVAARSTSAAKNAVFVKTSTARRGSARPRRSTRTPSVRRGRDLSAPRPRCA